MRFRCEVMTAAYPQLLASPGEKRQDDSSCTPEFGSLNRLFMIADDENSCAFSTRPFQTDHLSSSMVNYGMPSAGRLCGKENGISLVLTMGVTCRPHTCKLNHRFDSELHVGCLLLPRETTHEVEGFYARSFNPVPAVEPITIRFHAQPTKVSMMRDLLKLWIIATLVTFGGCEPSTGPANHENFGHVSKGHNQDLRGRIEHALLHWQKHRQILFLGIAKHDKDTIAPRFFIIGKLPPLKDGVVSSSELEFAQSNNSDGLKMQATASNGPKIAYHLAADSPDEQLTIGNANYSLESGRVFLLDQSADSASVVQIQSPLSDLFADDRMEFSREEYTQALDSLASEHADVRDFLESFPSE